MLNEHVPVNVPENVNGTGTGTDGHGCEDARAPLECAAMSLRHGRFLLLSLALPVLACSSTSAKTTADAGGDGNTADSAIPVPQAGAATVDGTLDGQPFVPASATAFYDGFALVVFLSSLPNACALVQQQQTGTYAASLTDVTFAFDVGSLQSSVVVGAYTEVIDDNPGAYTFELQTDVWSSTCQHTGSEQGGPMSTVNLTTVGTSYIGSFDVTFTSGDHLTGAFNAPFCAVDVPDGGPDGGVVTCSM